MPNIRFCQGSFTHKALKHRNLESREILRALLKDPMTVNIIVATRAVRKTSLLNLMIIKGRNI